MIDALLALKRSPKPALHPVRRYWLRTVGSDIRMVKIKQKVSGCQRTLAGAQDFAAMRSYLATGQARPRPFDVLTELTSGNVWTPATS